MESNQRNTYIRVKIVVKNNYRYIGTNKMCESNIFTGFTLDLPQIGHWQSGACSLQLGR